MSVKAKKDPKDKILHAALDLAEAGDWGGVTLAAIARKAKISLSDLRENFEDKTDILAYLGRVIDKRALKNAAAPDPDVPLHERLFDILMDRYEILNDYRAGLVSVLHGLKCDPKQAVIGLPHLCRSMNWALEAAGADTSGIKGALAVAGLTGVYLKGLWAWKDDDSADLARTMAALDKALGRAERVAQVLNF